MKYILFIFLLSILLVLNACNSNISSESSTSIKNEIITESNAISEEPGPNVNGNKINNAVILYDDNQVQRIELPYNITINDNNRIGFIPTGFGGKIRLQVDNEVYDVCIGLALEKDKKAYGLGDLEDIIRESLNLTLRDLYEYTVSKGGKEFILDEEQSNTIIDMLMTINRMDEIKGEIQFDMSFKNKLGADFDLSLENNVLYSKKHDAYFNITDYKKYLNDIISSLS